MKRKLGYFGVILLAGLIFAACDNSTGSSGSGTAPVIDKVFASASQSACFNGIEKTTFFAGDTVWVGVVVTDPDKDVVSLSFTL
jgi:hypothetical protein